MYKYSRLVYFRQIWSSDSAWYEDGNIYVAMTESEVREKYNFR